MPISPKRYVIQNGSRNLHISNSLECAQIFFQDETLPAFSQRPADVILSLTGILLDEVNLDRPLLLSVAEKYLAEQNIENLSDLAFEVLFRLRNFNMHVPMELDRRRSLNDTILFLADYSNPNSFLSRVTEHESLMEMALPSSKLLINDLSVIDFVTHTKSEPIGIAG